MALSNLVMTLVTSMVNRKPCTFVGVIVGRREILSGTVTKFELEDGSGRSFNVVLDHYKVVYTNERMNTVPMAELVVQGW